MFPTTTYDTYVLDVWHTYELGLLEAHRKLHKWTQQNRRLMFKKHIIYLRSTDDFDEVRPQILASL